MKHATSNKVDASNDHLNIHPLIYNVERSGNVIISVESMMETSAETTHIKNMHSVSDVLLQEYASIKLIQQSNHSVSYLHLKHLCCSPRDIDIGKLWINDSIIDFFIASIKIDLKNQQKHEVGIFPCG